VGETGKAKRTRKTETPESDRALTNRVIAIIRKLAGADGPDAEDPEDDPTLVIVRDFIEGLKKYGLDDDEGPAPENLELTVKVPNQRKKGGGKADDPVAVGPDQPRRKDGKPTGRVVDKAVLRRFARATTLIRGDKRDYEKQYVYRFNDIWFNDGYLVFHYVCWKKGCNVLLNLCRGRVYFRDNGEQGHRGDCTYGQWILKSRSKELMAFYRKLVWDCAEDQDPFLLVAGENDHRVRSNLPSIWIDHKTINRWRNEAREMKQEKVLLEVMGDRDKWVRGMLLKQERWEHFWVMSPGAAAHLKQCKIWLVDGTFYSCAKGLSVLLNVMGFNGISFVPCAHFLLTGMTAESYLWAFEELLTALAGIPGELMLERVITDFEKGLRNGIELAFRRSTKYSTKKIRFSGCLFHFGQAVYRYWQGLRLNPESFEFELSKKLLSFFLWLPYFEHEWIKDLFAILVMGMGKDKSCEKFIAYFRDTWMTCIDWWRIREGDVIVTNDGVEVYHRELKRHFKQAHPLIEKLSKVLHNMCADRLLKDKRLPAYDGTAHWSERRKIATDFMDTLVRPRVWAFVTNPLTFDGMEGLANIGIANMKQAIAAAEAKEEYMRMKTLISEANAKPPDCIERGEELFNMEVPEDSNDVLERFREDSTGEKVSMKGWDLVTPELLEQMRERKKQEEQARREAAKQKADEDRERRQVQAQAQGQVVQPRGGQKHQPRWHQARVRL
jgi:hypothetical protein